MKLSSASVDQARNQISVQPIPDDHPVAPQLAQLFGNHTFFLDEEGLLIIEPVDSTRGTSRMGKVVKLANWADANHSALDPHQPETTDVLVELALDGSEPPD